MNKEIYFETIAKSVVTISADDIYTIVQPTRETIDRYLVVNKHTDLSWELNVDEWRLFCVRLQAA